MRTLSVLLLFGMAGIISSCSNLPNDNPSTRRNLLRNLNQWPDSLVIERFYYGGMLPQSESIIINRDSCMAEYSYSQVQNTYRYAVTKEELNNLLHELNKNHIDDIRVKKLDYIVYDAPTMGIRIRLGNIDVTLSNSASEDIAERNKGDFMRCYELIGSLVNKRTEALNKNCCFIPGPELHNIPHAYLSIIPEGADTSYGDSCNNLPEQICLKLWPGRYNFQVHITRRGEVSYTDYIASTYPVIDLQRDTVYHLSMPSDSVLLVN